MARTAKTQKSRLTPSPKALQKALEQSAGQAQKLADAFGLVVPGIKPKTASCTPAVLHTDPARLKRRTKGAASQ